MHEVTTPVEQLQQLCLCPPSEWGCIRLGYKMDFARCKPYYYWVNPVTRYDNQLTSDSLKTSLSGA